MDLLLVIFLGVILILYILNSYMTDGIFLIIKNRDYFRVHIGFRFKI